MVPLNASRFSTELQEIDIVSQESLPNAVHGKHGILENSGLSSPENFQTASRQIVDMSRSLTSEITRDPKISEDKESPEKKDFFFEVHKNAQNSKLFTNLIKEIDPEFIQHGGGSLYDYAKLAQLRGQKVTTITIHESRMLQLLYDGEENLAQKNIARGEFVESEFDFLLKQANEISEELGVKIEFVLELENFGEGAMGDRLRKKREEFRSKFQYTVLSTHFMRKNPNYSQPKTETDDSLKEFSENHQFLDGSLSQFEDVIKGHNSSISDITSDNNIQKITNIVKTYITDVINQVKREGEAGMILGHCDLIKLNIHKIIAGKNNENKEKADAIITQVFAQDKIQNMYGDLFDAVNKKEMLVEVNLAGAAKGVGFYGKDLLDKMKEKGVKVVIGSDSHNVYDEKGSDDIWEGKEKYKGESVRHALINANITNIYEIGVENQKK